MMMSVLTTPSAEGMPTAVPSAVHCRLPVPDGDAGDEGSGLVQGGAQVGRDDSGAQAVRDRHACPRVRGLPGARPLVDDVQQNPWIPG